METKRRCVALVGFGTVGTGVAKILLQQGEKLREKTGFEVVLKHICDIDITTDRGVPVPPGVLTTDLEAVLAAADTAAAPLVETALGLVKAQEEDEEE